MPRQLMMARKSAQVTIMAAKNNIQTLDLLQHVKHLKVPRCHISVAHRQREIAGNVCAQPQRIQLAAVRDNGPVAHTLQRRDGACDPRQPTCSVRSATNTIKDRRGKQKKRRVAKYSNGAQSDCFWMRQPPSPASQHAGHFSVHTTSNSLHTSTTAALKTAEREAQRA